MSSARSVAVIINPISGGGGRPEAARRRAVRAAEYLGSRGLEPHVFVTEGAGHARELAHAQLRQGATTVVAWGGDGTVNEVASAVAFTAASMAIVPSGSGNGLARELGIPFDPNAALAIAVDGAVRTMDAGELDGRLFVNVSGLGLDARVAHRFAAGGLRRRGFWRYIEITLQELLTFRPQAHTVTVAGRSWETRALLIAVANARQYGNGAVIAPQARIDDGLIDLVVVEDRSRLLALLQAPRIFLGQIARLNGVVMHQVTSFEIASAHPIAYHIDGEPFHAEHTINGQIRPKALKVRVPTA